MPEKQNKQKRVTTLPTFVQTKQNKQTLDTKTPTHMCGMCQKRLILHHKRVDLYRTYVWCPILYDYIVLYRRLAAGV